MASREVRGLMHRWMAVPPGGKLRCPGRSDATWSPQRLATPRPVNDLASTDTAAQNIQFSPPRTASQRLI
jgi:hypothetical protein